MPRWGKYTYEYILQTWYTLFNRERYPAADEDTHGATNPAKVSNHGAIVGLGWPSRLHGSTASNQ